MGRSGIHEKQAIEIRFGDDIAVKSEMEQGYSFTAELTQALPLMHTKIGGKNKTQRYFLSDAPS